MSDDIVKRLRLNPTAFTDIDVFEAADEIEHLTAERDALRAELAAERERADKWEKRAMNAAEESCDLLIERDALRALVLALEVFVERVESGHWQTPMQMKDECIEFRARIDALLNKGGGDE